MKCFSNALNSLENLLIKNSWLHTKRAGVGVTLSHDHTLLCNEEAHSFQAYVTRLISDSHLLLSVSVLLHHPAEEDVLAVASDSQLIDSNLSSFTVKTAAEDDEADPVVLHFVREQFKTITQAKIIIESCGHSTHGIPTIAAQQRDIQTDIEAGRSKTKITDVF